ncbi:antibiotic biosynthesis monooxygenase (plasmid) [Bacillus sp. F19]|nr:antibiotic biosynthesis monooxygenase [Bacillus sp. F19]
MHIVHVSIRVKEEYLSSFKEATAENAKHSLQEAGVIRFDVLEKRDDPCEFLLVEVYNTLEDQLNHRETEHFKKWRIAVTKMLIEPYTFTKYKRHHIM